MTIAPSGRLKEIADTRVHYGFLRIHILLWREGWRYNRECLEIEVGQDLKGINVVAVMERIKALRGVVSKRIHVDKGSEFISQALDKCSYDNQVTLDFSRNDQTAPHIQSSGGKRTFLHLVPENFGRKVQLPFNLLRLEAIRREALY